MLLVSLFICLSVVHVAEGACTAAEAAATPSSGLTEGDTVTFSCTFTEDTTGDCDDKKYVLDGAAAAAYDDSDQPTKVLGGAAVTFTCQNGDTATFGDDAVATVDDAICTGESVAASALDTEHMDGKDVLTVTCTVTDADCASGKFEVSATIDSVAMDKVDADETGAEQKFKSAAATTLTDGSKYTAKCTAGTHNDDSAEYTYEDPCQEKSEAKATQTLVEDKTYADNNEFVVTCEPMCSTSGLQVDGAAEASFDYKTGFTVAAGLVPKTFQCSSNNKFDDTATTGAELVVGCLPNMNESATGTKCMVNKCIDDPDNEGKRKPEDATCATEDDTSKVSRCRCPKETPYYCLTAMKCVADCNGAFSAAAFSAVLLAAILQHLL